MHDSDDLQFVAANSEDECIGKDIETALAQVTFKTTMDLRAGDHAVFGILPFRQKASLESFLLRPIPFGSFEPFFAGYVVIIHPHGLNGCAKALVDLFPKVFGGDEFGLACVDVLDPPLQFVPPFGTQLMFILIQAFQNPAGELGAIHEREVENFLLQALVGLYCDSRGWNIDEA